MTSPMPWFVVAYGVSLAAVFLAVFVRWLLAPLLGDSLPLVTLYAAVAGAVWFGGYRPALFAAVIGYLACAELFIEPKGTLGLGDVHGVAGLFAYLLTCLFIIAFGEVSRRSQRRLDEHREQLRVTLTSIGDAVISTDPAGYITYLNPVAESLTGWRTTEAVGEALATVFRIVNESSRQPVENPVEKALREGVVVGLANHTVLIRKDGTELPIDDSAAPMHDAEGRISGCVLIFRDITARRRIEKQEAESLAAASFLAAIVTSSQDAIVSKTVDGTIQSWNEGAERLFGYSAAEAIGKNIRLIIPADRASEEDQIIAHIRAGKRVDHFETIRVRKDGTLVPISVSISPIRNRAGEVIGASKIARDISERIEVQERLQTSAARAAADLSAMARLREVGATCASPEGVDSDCLKEILDGALELSRAEKGNIQVLDSSGVLTIAVQRGFDEPFLSFFSRVRAGDGSACGKAMQGTERIVVEDITQSELFAGQPSQQVLLDAGVRAVQSIPLVSSTGRILGIISTHFVRPHRPGERELQFLDLLARQAADYLERKQYVQSLKDADRRKDEFLAMLAHELRNPLAAIRNAIQVLLLDASPAADLRRSREIIDVQAQHMVRLLDDLLDVSRISHDKLVIRKERLELKSILQDSVETIRPLAEDLRHKVTICLPPGSIYVHGDRVRLAQIFSNLLNNACKYTQRGGQIWLTSQPHGSDIVVSVKDSGIGISGEELSHVFDMFMQADKSVERSHGGLGLGLTLVKRLVEMHDGSIEAFSDGPGLGSEFVVRLPMQLDSASEPTRHGPEKAAKAEPAARRRVLVVDDNQGSAKSLAMLLNVAGHDTRMAHDGLEAVTLAEQFLPDVVLLDIGLPKLNGFDACQRIRQQAWGRSMKIVALTGWGQDDDRRKSSEAGFDQHLVKPVEFAELQKVLNGLGTGSR